MFEKFKYERIPLSLIDLDNRNPRIVSQTDLKTTEEILTYFFEYEDLADFLKTVAAEGRNPGAERPYIVKNGKRYVVIEGNTRIAAYKLLTRQLTAPALFISAVPHVPTSFQEDILSVDCSIAPSRDLLLPIMARAHFGRGDKSQWSYLGSRKTVFDEWSAGKSISHLANVFDRKQPAIRDLILEYKLYLEALGLTWTVAEYAELTKPTVEFNPPVRFLQTSGHKSAIGIKLDKVNLAVVFEGADAKYKFQHLIRKLVLGNEKGLGATSTYAEVFADFVLPPKFPEQGKAMRDTGDAGEDTFEGDDPREGRAGAPDEAGKPKDTDNPKDASRLKQGALFDYQVTGNSLVLKQLMKEARDLNTRITPQQARHFCGAS